MNDLVSVLRIDIRQGRTDNLRHWVHQLPIGLTWSVLMNTYANDIGCAPLATYIWKKYKEGDILAAYEVANTLSLQKKSRTTRFAATLFWKATIHEPEPFRKLLGQIVGDLQSVYRYDWDPYLQFRVFAAAAAVGPTEEAWDTIMEIATVLGKSILRNLAALRSMHKLTEQIEFFVLALISLTQPGEWEIPEPTMCPRPYVSPTWSEEVPDYCHDLTTSTGWMLIAEISLARKYTPVRAMKFGIRMYYKASLWVSNERTNCVSQIYKHFSLLVDLNETQQLEDAIRTRIKLASVLRKLPRTRGILGLMKNPRDY